MNRSRHPLLRVVLHEPEIPNNTGNIGRTCVAAGCELHLVRPLGFDTSEKACRRAGLDYWPRLGVVEHESWGAVRRAAGERIPWLLSTRGRRPYFDAAFDPGDWLVFGKESAGLPAEVLASVPGERVLAMPMVAGERSLNVATAVCAVVYEAVRQFVARGEVRLGPDLRIP